MDKLEFIEKAPQYYFLALAYAFLGSNGKRKTIAQLDTDLERSDYRYLQKSALVEQATNLLSKCPYIEIIDDDFGPTIYGAKEGLGDWFNGESAEEYTLFAKFSSIGFNKTWLLQAVRNVNNTYDSLQIEYDDFDDEVVEFSMGANPSQQTQ